MLGDNPQLMKSAVQDMLYAKSGASAPAAEVEKAMQMFTPSRLSLPLVGSTGIPLERDATAAAKIDNFITDMQRMRDEIGGQPITSQGAAVTGAQPSATATGPNGQKLGLVNGQWVPL